MLDKRSLKITHFDLLPNQPDPPILPPLVDSMIRNRTMEELTPTNTICSLPIQIQRPYLSNIHPRE